MRQLFISALLLIPTLMFINIDSFAIEESDDEQEVISEGIIVGELAYYDSEQNIIMVRGADELIHTINLVEAQMLEGITIGENIVVRVVNGRAVSIDEAEDEPPPFENEPIQ